MDLYLEGYRQGVDEGRRLDIDVLLGLELRFTENDNDYLVYGVTEEFLKARPDLHRSTIAAFMADIAGREDILVYQAHPFRHGCFPADPSLVHGLEIYNGNPRHESWNNKAARLARENHLMILSGSDFHRREDVGTGGVFFPERVRDSSALLQQLRRLVPGNLVTNETNTGMRA